MKKIIVTGSAGLIGSEASVFFHNQGYEIIGIDNDSRAFFFGEAASTKWNADQLKMNLQKYQHFNIDIRNYTDLEKIFLDYTSEIAGIIHTAAQPSHDWAAKEPLTDFTINANGTLNLLELTRKHCPNAVFIFTSTNKVYGDTPNFLPLIELEKRYEVNPGHVYAKDGIDETMSIDQSKHSLFGVSKVAADLMVQEYGKYFGMKTGAFRGGCLTGPAHSGAELHGFLAYLVLCAVNNKPYTVFGYKGKQVRDNIHSKDLINALWEFFKNPRAGEVYNMGGSRYSNISMLEAIEMIEQIHGTKLNYTITENNRIGDHIWYVSNVNKFKQHYPQWNYQYDSKKIITEMLTSASDR
jgi:CDP-paratose 2-epimerase